MAGACDAERSGWPGGYQDGWRSGLSRRTGGRLRLGSWGSCWRSGGRLGFAGCRRGRSGRLRFGCCNSWIGKRPGGEDDRGWRRGWRSEWLWRGIQARQQHHETDEQEQDHRTSGDKQWLTRTPSLGGLDATGLGAFCRRGSSSGNACGLALFAFARVSFATLFFATFFFERFGCLAFTLALRSGLFFAFRGFPACTLLGVGFLPFALQLLCRHAFPRGHGGGLDALSLLLLGFDALALAGLGVQASLLAGFELQSLLLARFGRQSLPFARFGFQAFLLGQCGGLHAPALLLFSFQALALAGLGLTA
jgi:hypothetical protein